jgi:hypothetical protein
MSDLIYLIEEFAPISFKSSKLSELDYISKYKELVPIYRLNELTRQTEGY